METVQTFNSEGRMPKGKERRIANMHDVALPTPAETDALAREELREVDQRKRSPAARNLASFLRNAAQRNHITGNNDARTNIIDQGRRITYALPDQNTQRLFEMLEAGRREKITAHFSERQGTPEAPKCGIMLDYDIIVDRADACITERGLHRVACRIVYALRRDLIFPSTNRQKEMVAHVFSIVKTRPVPVKTEGTNQKPCFKYGFHVLIPGIKTSRGYKKYLIRSLRSDKMIGAVLTSLGAVGDPSECLDGGSASVPVLFAGSCKRGGTPYAFGPIFEIGFDTSAGASVPDKFGFMPIVRTLKLGALEAKYNLVAETSLCFQARYDDGRKSLVQKQIYDYRAALASQINDLANRTSNQIVSDKELLIAEHSLSTLAIHDPEARYLHQILDILDDSFFTERNKWRDVIFALANTSKTYKPLAEWFSHKAPALWTRGGQENLDQIWDDAVFHRGNVENPLTNRSIIHWAKMCNPERYHQISEQNFFTILTNYVYEYGGVLEHYMVAKVLHAMLGNKFVVDIDEGNRGKYTYCWFEFVVPCQTAILGEVWKWRKEVEPDELYLYLSEELVKVMNQIAEHINEKRAAAESEEQGLYYKKLGAAFKGSSRKIFNNGFKSGVIKEATKLFRRRGFVEMLDSRDDLLGVGNGVLLLGAKCTLIDHFHEFPVSKFTSVCFRRFNPEEVWTTLLLKALSDIVPEDDFRNWFLFFMASSLAGGVKVGFLLLWLGGGANAKTWIMRMIAKVLGKNYAKKLNIALLTSKREDADKPNSALMQLKGCRYGYVEETQKAEVLNSQRLKEIVNPGDISGRDLNKTQETFEVTANIVVGQNFDFEVKTKDHGTWRRLRHYTSKVQFCRHPNPKNPYELKDDPRYIREYINDPECHSAMLGILVHYYERLQSEYGGDMKRVPCQTLDEETEAFRNSQDTINRFVTMSVVKSPGSGFTYTLADVAGEYIRWYAQHIRQQHHIVSEIIQNLENSALQKFIHRSQNRSLVLEDCRILTKESHNLLMVESYIGAAAVPIKQDDRDILKTFGSKRKDWWNPEKKFPKEKQHKKNNALLFGGIGDEFFSETGPKLTVSTKNSICDDDLEALLDGEGGTCQDLPVFQFTLEDVFEN